MGRALLSPASASALTIAAACAASAYVAPACVVAESYVYSAQAYDADSDCLSADHAIEVVRAKRVSSTCAPTCVEANGQLYVSTMCPPLPAIASEVAFGAPECVAARAAFDASKLCEPADDPDATTDAASPSQPETSPSDAAPRD